MLCDNCKDRDSVVKLVQMLEGGPKELHLCEKCAAEKGVETMAAAPAPQLAELRQTLADLLDKDFWRRSACRQPHA